MKVYIVTSGSYSDYQIRRIFLDPEKASEYQSSVSDANDVAVFDTDDTEKFETFRVLSIRSQNKYSFDVDFRLDNSLDNINPNTNYYGHSDEIHITRRIDKLEHTEDEKWKLIDKYKKVVQDLYAQIESLKQNEGWDTKMIQEWLNGQVK